MNPRQISPLRIAIGTGLAAGLVGALVSAVSALLLPVGATPPAGLPPARRSMRT